MNQPIRTSARDASRAVVSAQLKWAQNAGLRIDQSGWIISADAQHNLITPLSSSDRQAFNSGAGGELDTKMRAPHSSSALAYNCFAAARHDVACLRSFATLVNVSTSPTDKSSVNFEQKRPTGWRGIPPHLDVEVAFNQQVIAVESKMTELFGSKPAPAQSLASYLKYDQTSKKWRDVPRLRRAAELLATGDVKLELLDAPQLIKHALGLCRAKRRNEEIEAVKLVLLWFDAREVTDKAQPACDQLSAELEWLSDAIRGDISLVGVTHQQLIRAYRGAVGQTSWISWLEDRYL